MKLRRLFLLASLSLPLFAAEVPPPAPRLAVVIAIDQLRADYLARFRPFFGAGGFKRLLEGGADFQQAYYRHVATITAPDHATILSGVYPEVHGITANDWLDRATWEMVNNVEDRAQPLVGLPADEPLPALRTPKAGRSPRNFRATTLGDQLKLRFGANAKVFSASYKDRAAILLGGKLADGAYWEQNGRFITSRYYRESLPAWIDKFNAERRADRYFGQTWDRVLDPKLYDLVQGPDDAPGETADNGLGKTFPRKLTGGEAKLGPKFYTAFDNSPFSSVLLGEFVEAALHEEQLGQHAATDLLCVSFSQIDVIGHAYGPDSQEVMDSVIRLDRVLAHLLDALDREVGLKNCLLVLTADHGVAPLPERVQAASPGIPAGRILAADITAAAKKALDDAFGPQAAPEYWLTADGMGFHLRPSALAAKKVAAEAAAQVVKAAMLQQPFAAAAFTRAEILAGPVEGESPLAMVRRSYYPPNDRDVVFVAKPYFILRANGAQHGTYYDYDRHVPLIWFGAGVPRGVHLERVGIEDLVPTLAAQLGIPPPPEAKGRRLF